VASTGNAGYLKKSFTMVFQMLLCGEYYKKSLHLKAYKLSIIQDVERWMVCTPLSVKVFITLATQQHLEYHCKTFFETPCIFVVRGLESD
jgi:hypothetical protein